MTTKLKLFFKSLSLYNIFFKILVLFIIGILNRFLINNFFDGTLLIELFSLFSVFLYINKFLWFESANSEFIENNINYFKRPINKIINNNNNINKNYEFKTKFKRKCHWIFLEQFDSKFKNYEDFKSRWNPSKNYINLLKDQYYDKKDRIKIFNKTLLWFLHGRNK